MKILFLLYIVWLIRRVATYQIPMRPQNTTI